MYDTEAESAEYVAGWRLAAPQGLVPNVLVGDQVIPQAADQERPLGDDVRRADGTTFTVHYWSARRSLDAAALDFDGCHPV